ncbi:MAG: hypothetical protein DSY37_03505 [Hyperthermus sp.]|nr:MAG: hypothetical protein DSY37_03505 [Hyperthermus sp.]
MKKKERIRKAYDSTAEGYDELYGQEQAEKYEASLEKIRKAAGAAATLCDAGGGTLLFQEFLKKHNLIASVKYYVAIDLSLSMIKIARRRTAKLEASTLTELVHADVEHMPLRDKACSLLVSYTVIDLTDSPQNALREFARTSDKCIVSLLKKAQALRASVSRPGVMVGETSKDIIFYCESKQQPKAFKEERLED